MDRPVSCTLHCVPSNRTAEYPQPIPQLWLMASLHLFRDGEGSPPQSLPPEASHLPPSLTPGFIQPISLHLAHNFPLRPVAYSSSKPPYSSVILPQHMQLPTYIFVTRQPLSTPTLTSFSPHSCVPSQLLASRCLPGLRVAQLSNKDVLTFQPTS